MNGFPQRAFIQGLNTNIPKDNILVMEELQSRGVPVKILDNTDIIDYNPLPHDLNKMDLVVGDFA